MICLNCDKKNVCKHYDYLIKYDGLHIDKCTYKTNNPQPVFDSLKVHCDSKVALLSNGDRDDISSQIQKINNMNTSDEERNANFKIVSNPTELIECNTCKTKIYSEDIMICEHCKSEMCPSCGTQSYDCNEERFINICDSCDTLWRDEDETCDNVVELEDYYGRNTNPDTTSE